MKLDCNYESLTERAMEQSTSTCDDFFCFDEDERGVTEILLELPELIAKSNSDFRSGNSVSWAVKKRRSSIQDSSSRFREPLLPSPAPPRQRALVDNVNSVPLVVVEPEELNVKVVQATSPATPLSFPPSESDEKPEGSKRRRSHNKKLQQKLRMEETIDQITKNNEVLQREIEKVKLHYQNLQTENMLLKARKQEVIGLQTVEPILNLTLALPQATVKSPAVDTAPIMLPSRPLIVDQTAPAPIVFNGVPDLNEFATEAEVTMVGSMQARLFFLGLDSTDKAKTAAESRKRRMEICRAKLRPPLR